MHDDDVAESRFNAQRRRRRRRRRQAMPAYPEVDSAYTPQYGYFPFSPFGGLAVLCAWAGLGLAAVLLRRRDA